MRLAGRGHRVGGHGDDAMRAERRKLSAYPLAREVMRIDRQARRRSIKRGAALDLVLAIGLGEMEGQKKKRRRK